MFLKGLLIQQIILEQFYIHMVSILLNLELEQFYFDDRQPTEPELGHHQLLRNRVMLSYEIVLDKMSD